VRKIALAAIAGMPRIAAQPDMRVGQIRRSLGFHFTVLICDPIKGVGNRSDAMFALCLQAGRNSHPVRDVR
jgi:hypothetical protein